MRGADWVLVALSLGGIGALAFASEVLAPPLVGLDELRHHEGAAVAVEGRVLRANRAGAGAQLLTLGDAEGHALVFWPASEPVEGARLRVEGAVERVRGEWEVRAWRVAVLAPPGEPMGVEEAARLAPLLVGREVNVTGRVAWPDEGDPSLVGTGARLPVRASGLRAGEEVVVHGGVRYDASRAAFYLEGWRVVPA